MSGRLRARAARLIKQLDSGASYRDQIERDLAKRMGAAAAPTTAAPPTASSEVVCAGCQTRNDHDARFCKSCGQAISTR
jgi:hypothetical protein